MKNNKLTPKKYVLMNVLEETLKYILPSSEYTCILRINTKNLPDSENHSS